jgi:glycosyltransferase involved in cell wall biosynthesis
MSKTMITIPVFNGEQHLRRTLESCRSQSVPADVVVIDNQSTDASFSIASEYASNYSNFRVVQNSRNLGRIGNWNKCLEVFHEADNDYLILLFASDELMPDCVEEAEAEFSSDDELGVVVWPYEFINLDGNSSISRVFDRAVVLNSSDAYEQNLVQGSVLGASLSNSYSAKAIGSHKFEESYIGKSEFDIAVCKGFKISFLDEPLAKFHQADHHTYEYSKKTLRLPVEVELISLTELESSESEVGQVEYNELRDRIVSKGIERRVDLAGPKLEWRILKMLLRRKLIGGVRRIRYFYR